MSQGGRETGQPASKSTKFRRVEMQLASRPLADGSSYVDLVADVDALVLHEEDVGGTPDSIFGGGVEYIVAVRGAEPLARLLDQLGRDVGQDLSGPLTKARLRRVGSAMLQVFGSDLDLVRNYRGWLKKKKVPFTTHVL